MIYYELSKGNQYFESVTKNVDDFVNDFYNCIKSDLDTPNESQLSARINVNDTFYINICQYDGYKDVLYFNIRITKEFTEALSNLISKCLSYKFNKDTFIISISNLYSNKLEDFTCKFTIRDVATFVFPVKYLLNNFEKLIEYRVDKVKRSVRSIPILSLSKIWFANLDAFENVISGNVKINKIYRTLTTITPIDPLRTSAYLNIHKLDILEIYPRNIILSFKDIGTSKDIHQPRVITVRYYENFYDDLIELDYDMIRAFIKEYPVLLKMLSEKYKIPSDYFTERSDTMNVYYTLFDDFYELVKLVDIYETF